MCGAWEGGGGAYTKALRGAVSQLKKTAPTAAAWLCGCLSCWLEALRTADEFEGLEEPPTISRHHQQQKQWVLM
jgi:hypothetical protein